MSWVLVLQLSFLASWQLGLNVKKIITSIKILQDDDAGNYYSHKVIFEP